MTRRKDKDRLNREYIRKSQNEIKSRIYQKQEETERENMLISTENKLLKKIQGLPDELIRIIYDYMSGNAKLYCNFKFEYFIKTYLNISDNINIIEKLSKTHLLDLIYKGVLHKYPDIIESVSTYYYCLDIEEYIDVNGYRLFDLWENNNLIRDFNDNITSEDTTSRLDWRIKIDTKHAIYFYIIQNIDLYARTKRRILSHKNQILTENTLFLKIDKVFYLYKCLENLVDLKK